MSTNDVTEEAIQIGLHILKMMTLLKAKGGGVKYLAITHDEQILALAQKFTPEEETEILKYLAYQRSGIYPTPKEAAEAPNGYKLVPINPTDEMHMAGRNANVGPRSTVHNYIWNEMVRVAPIRKVSKK
jgi:hypothetical protein